MTIAFSYSGHKDYAGDVGTIDLNIGGPSASLILDLESNVYNLSGALGAVLTGLVVPAAVPLQMRAGAAAAAIAARFGASATEGLEIRVIDEVVSVGSVSNDLTEDVPAGAVILGVQGNADTALTGGGTTTNYGIGPVANPDLYSPTVGALTLNAKTNNIPDWAVLSALEDIQVNGITAGGAIGDTALTVGTVRVRIVYLALNSLDNA